MELKKCIELDSGKTHYYIIGTGGVLYWISTVEDIEQNRLPKIAYGYSDFISKYIDVVEYRKEQIKEITG